MELLDKVQLNYDASDEDVRDITEGEQNGWGKFELPVLNKQMVNYMYYYQDCSEGELWENTCQQKNFIFFLLNCYHELAICS